MTSLLGTGGRAWVIDSGRSYERLCHLLGGDYLDFSVKSQYCLNPFSGLDELTSQLPLIKTLLARMAADKQPLNSLQQAALERAIRLSWDKYKGETCITRVSEQLQAMGNETADRVGQMLYPYTDDGIYGAYFNGEANIHLNSDLVVLELGSLDNRPDLQQTILLLLMLRVSHEMYRGDRQRRKLCVIDEAWRLMAGGDAGLFIETGYRTARKFGGSYMTITQGLDDYNASANARAALRNSDWLFLMRQKAESLIQAKNQDLLHMDEGMLRLLSHLETRQGRYSEVAIMAPNGGLALGRLLVDPFSEKLYSTKAEEFASIEKWRAEGYDLATAVERLVAESEGR